MNHQSYLLRNCVLTVLLYSLSLNTYCQELKQTDIISIAEDLAADETDPEAAALFIEQLHELSENRVRINSADETELSRLFFLSDFQIKAIADHVSSTGEIVSVYEIASIPGFDRQIAEMLSPFITIENNRNVPYDTMIFRSRLLTNMIFKPGESDSSFIGSSWKLLTKYKVTAGRFSAGFTSEKDAGEKILSGTPPLPDFFSGHLTYNGYGIIRKLIAGDFSARFGQGTSINTGIQTGLSLTAPGYMRGRNEIKPYTSADENNFLRGLAAEFALKKIKLAMFFSHHRIDATTRLSDDSTTFLIDNFPITGLHNTPSLLLKKDAAAETFYGINFSCNLRYITLGLTWSESKFSIPVAADINNPEDLYDFEGKKSRTVSAFYSGLISKMLLYGEFSIDHAQNIALVQGITLRPSDRLTVNCLYRNYSPGFSCSHGRGPGYNSTTGNEQGILGNFTFEAAKHLFISAGCDIVIFPWLKYRTSFPSMGKKQEIKLKYLPSESLSFEISYNHRSSMTNNIVDKGIAGVQELTAGTFKTLARYVLNENLSLTTRIDFKKIEQRGSKGILMSQDLVYKFRRVPFSLWCRYCIFNTDDWDSRLYIYENDLLYSFSIPSFSGEGSRSYLMAEWEISDFAEFRAKYGITSLVRAGASPDDRDELKIQFRIWF